jgi:hypothetical protein
MLSKPTLRWGVRAAFGFEACFALAVMLRIVFPDSETIHSGVVVAFWPTTMLMDHFQRTMGEGALMLFIPLLIVQIVWYAAVGFITGALFHKIAFRPR